MVTMTTAQCEKVYDAFDRMTPSGGYLPPAGVIAESMNGDDPGLVLYAMWLEDGADRRSAALSDFLRRNLTIRDAG